MYVTQRQFAPRRRGGLGLVSTADGERAAELLRGTVRQSTNQLALAGIAGVLILFGLGLVVFKK